MKKSLVAVLMAGSISLGACATNDDFADNTVEDAATGAAIGAAAGAGVGAVVGGLTPIEGAVIGAAVGGLAGAVWADRDNDGRADGYYRDGQYYQGEPTGWRTASRNCPSVLGSAATGAAVGAAGGSAAVMQGSAADVALAAGTPLTVRLTEPVTVSVLRED